MILITDSNYKWRNHTATSCTIHMACQRKSQSLWEQKIAEYFPTP